MLHVFSLFICLFLFPVFGTVLTPPLLDLESKGGITANQFFSLFAGRQIGNSTARSEIEGLLLFWIAATAAVAAAPSVVSPLYIAFIYILTHPLALI